MCLHQNGEIIHPLTYMSEYTCAQSNCTHTLVLVRAQNASTNTHAANGPLNGNFTDTSPLSMSFHVVAAHQLCFS